MEVDINYFITPFMTENSPFSQNEVKGMRTGALNVSQIGQVRFLNEKNYLNRFQTVWDGKGV